MSTAPAQDDARNGVIGAAVRRVLESDPESGRRFRDELADRMPSFVPSGSSSRPPGPPRLGEPLSSPFASVPRSNGGLVGIGGNVVQGLFGSCFPSGATSALSTDWTKIGGCYPGASSGTGMTDLLNQAGKGLLGSLPGMLLGGLLQPSPDASAGEVAAATLGKKALQQLQAAGFDPAAIEAKLDKLFNGIRSSANVPIASGDMPTNVLVNGTGFAVRLTDPAIFDEPPDLGSVIEGNPTILAGDLALAGEGFVCQGAKGTIGGIYKVSPNVLMGATSVIVPRGDTADDGAAEAESESEGATAPEKSPEAKQQEQRPTPSDKPAPPEAKEGSPTKNAEQNQSPVDETAPAGPNQCGPEPPEGEQDPVDSDEENDEGPVFKNPDPNPGRELLPSERVEAIENGRRHLEELEAMRERDGRLPRDLEELESKLSSRVEELEDQEEDYQAEIDESWHKFEEARKQKEASEAGVTEPALTLKDAWELAQKVDEISDYIPSPKSGAKRVGKQIIQRLRRVRWKRLFKKGKAKFSRALAKMTRKKPVTGGVEAKNAALFEKYKRDLRRKMEKPNVTDPKLKDVIDQNYRKGAKIGSGSTADAIRHTKETGELVGGSDHVIKGQGTIKFLEKWLKSNPNASPNDRSAAEAVLKDLQDALQ